MAGIHAYKTLLDDNLFADINVANVVTIATYPDRRQWHWCRQSGYDDPIVRVAVNVRVVRVRVARVRVTRGRVSVNVRVARVRVAVNV